MNSQRKMSSDFSDESESSPKWNELRMYRFVMFCVPIFFTFILLFLFYVFYLRPRRVNWSSLRMRTTASSSSPNSLNYTQSLSEMECGLRKELRELLPIIVYKESFSIRDTQCSVCLGEYEAEERLQQIPACGHTFHINCIDHWLSSRATCPLCRLSLLPSPKPRPAPENSVAGETSEPGDAESTLRADDGGGGEEELSAAGGSDQSMEFKGPQGRATVVDSTE